MNLDAARRRRDDSAVSQFPYPYPPSGPVDYGRGTDPIAPARRACVAMIVMGVLFLACGVMMGGVAAIITPDKLDQVPNAAQIHQLEQQVGLSFRTIASVMAGVLVVPGFLFILMGILTRRGGKVSVVLSLILTSITMIIIGINMLATLVQGASNPAAVAPSLCVGLIPGIVCVLILVWLIQALRNSSQVAAMRQQYQAQYWQLQQQQQAYQQPMGYGMPGYPPPAAPPPPQYPAPYGGAQYGYGTIPPPPSAPAMPPSAPPAPSAGPSSNPPSASPSASDQQQPRDSNGPAT